MLPRLPLPSRRDPKLKLREAPGNRRCGGPPRPDARGLLVTWWWLLLLLLLLLEDVVLGSRVARRTMTGFP